MISVVLGLVYGIYVLMFCCCNNICDVFVIVLQDQVREVRVQL